MIETTLNGKTKDIAQDNIEQLKQLFPEIITEDKIDFEKLREILGEEIDDSNERYDFSWKGKHNSIKIALNPSDGTLRPIEKNSKNWNTTENLYIEGDNLEVLKLLQKSYYGKIKMIYLDPPYNTGHDFVYSDKFEDSLENYVEQTEEGFNVSSNPETSGRYHTNWLNMMYPRLKIARNLLKEDGVILISIDDNEYTNLVNMSKEIFGEENIDTLIWQKVDNDSGKMKITYRVRVEHEYVLICYKNKNKTFFNKFIEERNYKNEYDNPDNDNRGPYKQAIISSTEEKSNENSSNFYSVTTPSGKVYTRQWRVSEEEMLELIEDNRIYFGKNGDSVPSLKAFINEPKLATPTTILSSVGTAKTAGKDIENMFGSRQIFSYPKPKELIKHLIQIVTDNEYTLNPNIEKNRKVFYPGVKINTNMETEKHIILDFFSGSSTTAEAVLNLNLENNLDNVFIMVQLPEQTPDKSKAREGGYSNICEIGEERIRRAGDMLLKENPDADIDIGFKVFKLDSSNLTKWNPDVDNLEQSLIDAKDNIVEGRSELDLVYEIMLKYGLELTLPVEELKYEDYTFYSVGMGSLVVCLNDHIKRDVADAVLKIKEDESPSVMRVVFKDNGFEGDSDKTNVKEILRNNEIDEFITI